MLSKEDLASGWSAVCYENEADSWLGGKMLRQRGTVETPAYHLESCDNANCRVFLETRPRDMDIVWERCGRSLWMEQAVLGAGKAR